MAEERKAKPAQSQAADDGKQAKKIPTDAAGIRKELETARRDLALQKLDSPARLKQLRRALARTLTKERLTAAGKQEAVRG
ncbi:MAG: hypothetical protein M3N59_02195 [bacterium]|nr:hypothetical protein [bacterium]